MDAMLSRPRTLLIAALSMVLAAGCFGEQESTVRIIKPARTIAAATPQGPAGAAGGVGLEIRRGGAFASHLVDGEGHAIYLFTADADQEVVSCTGDCAEAWPPVITSGDPVALEPAVDDDLISTITREDGSRQVTYDEWPLYYFANDSRPGDTKGHGVESFDGTWYLISPEGEAIEAKVESY